MMRAETEKKSLKEVERQRFLYVAKMNSQAIRSKTSREAKKGRLARKLSGIFPSKRRRKAIRMERIRTKQSMESLARNRQYDANLISSKNSLLDLFSSLISYLKRRILRLLRVKLFYRVDDISYLLIG